MTNKPTRKAYEKHVARLVREFRELFYLHEYTYRLLFVDELDPVTESGTDICHAEIHIDSTYLTFTIEIADVCFELFKQGQAWTLADIICHELAHVLIEPVFELARPAISISQAEFAHNTKERQTQRVANTVLNLIPRKVWEIC